MCVRAHACVHVCVCARTCVHVCVCVYAVCLYTCMYISLSLIQRPRKLGAKFTGNNLKPDEHMQPNLSFSWDAKR